MERRPSVASGDNTRTPAGLQNWNLQTRLEVDAVCAADAPQKTLICGAAAHEDVLSVVVPNAVSLERPSSPPEPVAALQKYHRSPGVGAVQGGGEAGQPAAHHHDPPAFTSPLH